MDIVKKNIVSILCGVVAIICVVLVFYPFNGLYAGLVTEVNTRKGVGDQLNKVRHEPRTWPTLDPNEANHVALTHFPTQATIDIGTKLTQSWTQEATDFLNNALAYQIGRMQPLVPGALPGSGQLSLAYRFADLYKVVFTPVLPDAKTGEPAAALGVLKGQLPPTDADVKARVDDKVAWIQANMPAKSGDKIINQPDVDAAVAKAQHDTPIEMRQNVALHSVVYLDPIISFQPEVRIPANAAIAPSVNDIFVAQVGLWVQQEVCRAIAETNSNAKQGVLDAPIKRLLSVRVNVPFSAVVAPAGQPAGEPAVAPGVAALPAAKVPVEFSKNPLGQVSNEFYDVIPFTLSLVVDADSLPSTLTSLTRNRFIMIRGMAVLSQDAGVAAAQGFMYGNQPVVQVNLRCQYLMLRRFLGPMMPQDIIRGLTAQATPAQ